MLSCDGCCKQATLPLTVNLLTILTLTVSNEMVVVKACLIGEDSWQEKKTIKIGHNDYAQFCFVLKQSGV